jgi:hypothetical protein
VPDLHRGGGAGPFWRRHAEAAADALREAPDPLILVGHSGAGVLLPPIRQSLGRRIHAYVFVDAALPDATVPRKGTGAFADHLAALHAQGRRIPEWTDAELRDLIPDDSLRRALLAELRPQPPEFWDETVPVFAGWPDAPCAYLRFAPNPSYDAAAAEARRRGWPHRELDGGHFHMLSDAPAVADALIVLAAELAVDRAEER